MTVSTLIARLQAAQKKYGNIDVVLHVHDEGHSGDIEDIAVFSNSFVRSETRLGKTLWLSTEVQS